MDIYNLVGFREVEFTDQKTGLRVHGYSLFLERNPTPDEKIQGVECVKQFISSRYISYVPCLGDKVRLLYNKYGKIGSIEIV